MSDLTIVASMSRTRLSLAPLNLNDDTNFQIVSAGPGGRTWVRDTASAPSVHGEAQVSARMGMQVAPLVIRVLGATKAALDANSVLLVNAFSQLTYNLTITINGGTETWKCWAADMRPSDDGSWDKFRLMASRPRQIYTLAVPRQPVPVSGVM